MVADTKFFGQIDIEDDKIITFPNGIIGFENLTRFALIYDSERENRSRISWLQSMEEPLMVLPVINPIDIFDEYTPIIEDELMKNIGDPADADVLIFVSMSIPSKLEEMTVNLKAPFIINTVDRKAMQVIVENQEYAVKYKVYDILKELKEKAGE